MADKQNEVPKVTPVELIKKNHPLIEKISRKFQQNVASVGFTLLNHGQ